MKGSRRVIRTEWPGNEEEGVELEVELVRVRDAGQGGGEDGEIENIGLQCSVRVRLETWFTFLTWTMSL